MSQLRAGCVTMWTTETTPNLEDAERMLENERVPYEAIDVNKEYKDEGEKKVFREALYEFTHSKTLPSVFVGSEYLGTLSDLQMALKSGELKKQLKSI